MDIECTQENLARALITVSRMVGTRGTLPVLGNILLSVEKGRLKVAATDLEVGIETWIGGKVDGEGGITVPARLLVDFVATNSDPKIHLTATDTTLHLTSNRFTANIKGIAAAEFPQIPDIKRSDPLTFSTAALKTAIIETVLAAAIDETRPVLMGVLLTVAGTTAKLAATDSYRLAEKTLTLPKKHATTTVIIPARTLQELARLVTDASESIEVYLAENQILFHVGETQFISRVIDGTFPDYAQIIPQHPTTTVEIETAAFVGVMKMASFFARESANNVRLKVSQAGLEVTAISPQLGDSVSRLAATVTGEPVEIAFNAKFILDALAIFPGDTLTLELSGQLQPGVLRPKGSTDYLYLIMPLRLDS